MILYVAISVIILLLMVIVLIITFFSSKKYSTLIDINKLELLEIENKIDEQKIESKNFLMFNPSICKGDSRDEIIIIHRISGSHVTPHMDVCLKELENITTKVPTEGLSSYIDLFHNSQEKTLSGIACGKYNIYTREYTEIPRIVSTFLTEKNFNPFTERPQNARYIGESYGLEDPRLFKYMGDTWVYCHFRGYLDGFYKNTPMIFPLNNNLGRLIPLKIDGMKRVEKNWVPFQWGDCLYGVYSISPHKIISIDIDTGICKNIYTTHSDIFKNQENIGSTCSPELFEYKGETYFLAIGHIRGISIQNKLIRKNFFYIFENNPPFSIISATHIYNIGNPPVHIEYCSGLIVYDDYVIISYGVDDCYSSISKLSKDTIAKSLGLI